jgi:hypothetical protein
MEQQKKNKNKTKTKTKTKTTMWWQHHRLCTCRQLCLCCRYCCLCVSRGSSGSSTGVAVAAATVEQ